LTTGLDPAMTLGCGGFGGNITSDNISPKHLINVKRVAYELRPVIKVPTVPIVPAVPKVEFPGSMVPVPGLPKAPSKPAPDTIEAESLTNRIDKFLATRLGGKPTAPVAPSAPLAAPVSSSTSSAPEQFVCEDDVRQAVREGRKLLVSEKTIVTPAARDAGEAAKVFVYAGWPQL